MTILFGSTIAYGQSGNFYAPFHWKTKDSTQITVSKFGQYISVGLGGGYAMGEGDFNKLASYSFTYKSHVLSLTSMNAGFFSESHSYMNTNYYGILLGESIRTKHLFFSLSAGVSNANIDIKYLNPNVTSQSNKFIYYYEKGISYTRWPSATSSSLS